jgi:hypothetical protein
VPRVHDADGRSRAEAGRGAPWRPGSPRTAGERTVGTNRPREKPSGNRRSAIGSVSQALRRLHPDPADALATLGVRRRVLRSMALHEEDRPVLAQEDTGKA